MFIGLLAPSALLKVGHAVFSAGEGLRGLEGRSVISNAVPCVSHVRKDLHVGVLHRGTHSPKHSVLSRR